MDDDEQSIKIKNDNIEDKTEEQPSLDELFYKSGPKTAKLPSLYSSPAYVAQSPNLTPPSENADANRPATFFPGNPVQWFPNNIPKVTQDFMLGLKPMEYFLIREKMSKADFTKLPTVNYPKDFWNQVQQLEKERNPKTAKSNNPPAQLSTLKGAKERNDRNKNVNVRNRGKNNRTWKKTEERKAEGTISLPKEAPSISSHGSRSSSGRLSPRTLLVTPQVIANIPLTIVILKFKLPYLDKLVRINIWGRMNTRIGLITRLYQDIIEYAKDDIYEYVYEKLIDFGYINPDDMHSELTEMSKHFLLEEPIGWLRSNVKKNKHAQMIEMQNLARDVKEIKANEHALELAKKLEDIKPKGVDLVVPAKDKPLARADPPKNQIPPLRPPDKLVVLDQKNDNIVIKNLDEKPVPVKIAEERRKVWQEEPAPRFDPFDVILEKPNSMFINNYQWLEDFDCWFPTEKAMYINNLVAGPPSDGRIDANVNTIMLHTDPLTAVFSYHTRRRFNCGLFSMPISFWSNKGSLLVSRELATQIINNNAFSVEDDEEIQIKRIRTATAITGTVNFDRYMSLGTRNMKRDTAFFCRNMWHIMQQSTMNQPFLKIIRVGLPAGGLSDTILMRYLSQLFRPLIRILKSFLEISRIGWIAQSFVFPLASTLLVLPIAILTLLMRPPLSMAQCTELVDQTGKGLMRIRSESFAIMWLDGCVKTLPLLALYSILVSKIGLDDLITQWCGDGNWKKYLVHGAITFLIFFSLHHLRNPVHLLLRMNLTRFLSTLGL